MAQSLVKPMPGCDRRLNWSNNVKEKLIREIETLAPQARAMFDDIAALTHDGEGITREAFGERETMAGNRLCDFASEEGIAGATDHVGNFHFDLPGADPGLAIMASHLDSVPVGGNYDGLAGVVAGLLVQAACKRVGMTPRHTLKTIGFRCEESPWFGTAYVGSKLALGLFSQDDLNTLKRFDSGDSLAGHLKAIGAGSDAASIEANRLRHEGIAAYLELHIEQGPLLDDLEVPVGIATAIRGNIRHPFAVCRGRYGHSAASPRHLRSDAVTATARLISAADRLWDGILTDSRNDDLIINFGIFTTDAEKHAMTKVPGEVRFSNNIGGINNELMESLNRRIEEEARRLADEHRVAFDFGPRFGTDGIVLDPAIADRSAEAAREFGIVSHRLPTVGHDAAMFARLGVPTGVILVRNQNGSHNPEENMRLEDFIDATKVLALCAVAA